MHLILGLSVYVCVFVEGINKYETGNFGNEPLCLYLCFCRGHENTEVWAFCQQPAIDSYYICSTTFC